MRDRTYNRTYYILDADNRPVAVDLFTWANWLENPSNRIVDKTDVTSQCHVSTVFLSIDHRWNGNGPPILFETMIFGGPEEINEYQWRYSSWDDAVTGHKAAVRKARQALGQRVTHDAKP